MAAPRYYTLHPSHCVGCGHTSLTSYIYDGVHYDFVSRAAPTSVIDDAHDNFFDGLHLNEFYPGKRPLWWTLVHELNFLYLLFRFYLTEASPEVSGLTAVALHDHALTIRDYAYFLGSDSVLYLDVLESIETLLVEVMGEQI
jgi:hypothetical protein